MKSLDGKSPIIMIVTLMLFMYRQSTLMCNVLRMAVKHQIFVTDCTSLLRSMMCCWESSVEE